MTFAGPAEADIKIIREHFPREFTIADVREKLGWTHAKARQAIVMGVSLDYFHPLVERGVEHEGRLTTYENVEWRKQWITKPWGNSYGRRELGSGQSGQGENVLSVCNGAGEGGDSSHLSNQVRQSVWEAGECPAPNVSGGSQRAE